MHVSLGVKKEVSLGVRMGRGALLYGTSQTLPCQSVQCTNNMKMAKAGYYTLTAKGHTTMSM